METVDARGCTQLGGNPVICMPALDPNNKLAQEQAQLIIGSLHLIAQRLHGATFVVDVAFFSKDLDAAGQVDVDQRLRIGDGQALAVGNGFHGGLRQGEMRVQAL